MLKGEKRNAVFCFPFLGTFYCWTYCVSGNECLGQAGERELPAQVLELPVYELPEIKVKFSI